MIDHSGIPPAPIARIVIVSYRSMAVLPQCLEALAQQTRSDFEVIIVNNDPADAAVSSLKLPDARFSLLEAGENMGFAAGSNLGAKGAQTEWIVTINPDAFPEPDWFETIMAAGVSYPHAASLGSVLILHDNAQIWDGLGDVCSVYGIVWRGAQGHDRIAIDLAGKDRYVLSPCAAAAAYRRDVFESCGGFDPDFFCYLEDVDLGLRMQLRGLPCVLVASATVRHMAGQSTAQGAQPSSGLYHSQKNFIRMMIKTFPVWLLPIGLAASVLPQLLLLWRTRHQDEAGQRAKGLKAGLGNWRSHWAARKAIQENRTLSTGAFARRLAWSPNAVRRKTPKFLGQPD